MNPRLTPELVLSAYCQGCFPMADPETGEISFYEPDPRALMWSMPAPGRTNRRNNG